MLCKTFALFSIVSLAQGACYNTTIINGITTAICKDETTGLYFEYQDYEGKHAVTGLATESLSDIYADYEDGISDLEPLSSPSVSNRLEGFWEACVDYIEGVCANDHVIEWDGSEDYYLERLRWMLLQPNGKRMQENPRAICTRWISGGTICVQWAINQLGLLEEIPLDVATFMTWSECQKHGHSTEFRAAMFPVGYLNFVQHYCVSNRNTGCVVNKALQLCPELNTTRPQKPPPPNWPPSWPPKWPPRRGPPWNGFHPGQPPKLRRWLKSILGRVKKAKGRHQVNPYGIP